MADRLRVRASFRLIGTSLHPPTVSRLLGLTPSHAHAKGDLVSRQSSARHPTGVWLIHSPLPDTASLREQLSVLLEATSEHASELLHLEDSELRADFPCGIHLTGDSAVLEFDAATLRRIADVNARLGFDIYCYEGTSE
jgi:hypothetical protein